MGRIARIPRMGWKEVRDSDPGSTGTVARQLERMYGTADDPKKRGRSCGC